MSQKKVLEDARILAETHCLSPEGLLRILTQADDETREFLREKAQELCIRRYGKFVFIRGLIEFTNICKNDCLYCGIRKGNEKAQRYRVSPEDILLCCQEGYALGFRTFVLQGGEDGYFTDDKLCSLVSSIKNAFPDCAITLSVGERSRESYQALFDAGADRYLLRHETADEEHYHKLHPANMSFSHRMQCLRDLKEIGFQTGCGFMVGSPYQTPENLVKDLLFLKEFQPHMVGIGPFLTHKDTPFAHFPNGSGQLTLLLLSMIRLLLPDVLLPATTALGTLLPDGRNQGILHGANVVMPNLSPQDAREKYMLYDNKLSSGTEAAESLALLKKSFQTIGYQVSVSRGDSLVPYKKN